MVFKKGGNLNNNERCHMEGRKLEIVSEITCLGVKLESTRGWRRQKVIITRIGNHSQVAIDKCLTTMPKMRVSMLNQNYQMKCDSRVLHWAEIWGTVGSFGNGRRNAGEFQQGRAKIP